MSVRRASALAATVAGAVVVAWSTTGAQATAPGSNGKIAFSRYRLTSNPYREEIFVANPDGTGARRITTSPANYLDEQPDWSPDGRKLAFSRCPEDLDPNGTCRVYTVNADGTGLRQVGPGCTTPSACEWDLDPAWSPDGSTIAFTHEWGPVVGTSPNDQIEHSEIFLMTADGSDPRQLTHVTDPGFTADVRAAAWSPDGKQLVFTVHNSRRGKPPGGRTLYVVNADGTGLRRLTPWSLHGGDHPDWAPDGSRIVFTFVRGENRGDLYTIRPDGTGLHRLTHSVASTTMLSGSYSPDGRSIVFATSAGATAHCTGCPIYPDVFVMRPDGTRIRPLIRSRNWDGGPDWGPR